MVSTPHICTILPASKHHKTEYTKKEHPQIKVFRYMQQKNESLKYGNSVPSSTCQDSFNLVSVVQSV